MSPKPLAIPFMPQKGLPPFHLRPWTPAELEQAQRMVRKAERLHRGRP
jgi:hypothetical protein